jgi:glycosyltransferase involved in cell wall biosynthesis
MIRVALALDAGERERLAAEARAYVVANFDKRHMCAATLAIYQEILRAEAAAGSGAEQPT